MICDIAKMGQVVDGFALWGLEWGDVSDKYCCLVSTFGFKLQITVMGRVFAVVMEIVIPPGGISRKCWVLVGKVFAVYNPISIPIS